MAVEARELEDLARILAVCVLWVDLGYQTEARSKVYWLDCEVPFEMRRMMKVGYLWTEVLPFHPRCSLLVCSEI